MPSFSWIIITDFQNAGHMGFEKNFLVSNVESSHVWQDPDHSYAGDTFCQRWCRRKLRLFIHMLGRIQITDILGILSVSACVEVQNLVVPVIIHDRFFL